MAFDPSTASLEPPTSGGFDPSTATPADTTAVDKPSAGPGKSFLSGAASVADFPLSYPGFVLSTATELASDTMGMLGKGFTGKSSKQVYQEGAQSGATMGEALMNPMQKIMNLFGEADAYSQAPLSQAMSWFSDKLQAGGKKLEAATGIPSEAVPLAANVGMITGVRGAGKAALAKGKEMMGGKPKTEAPIDTSKRPPPEATPEEKAAWKTELETRVKDRAAKVPLEQTAFKNKETGEITKTGPKHPEELKTDPKLEQGFVDEKGNFHTRDEAIGQAKRAGQIPEDHPLENPKGEQPGLHSGDLRKAGVKAFEVPKKEEVSTPRDTPPEAPTQDTQPTEPPKAPVTREEHKTALGENEDQRLALENAAEEAARVGNEAKVQEINDRISKLEYDHAKLQQDMPKVKFENPVQPTWQELQDHLWDTKTLGEALDKISKADIGGTAQKALVKALYKSDFIKSAKLEFSKEQIPFTDLQGKERKAVGTYTGGPGEHTVRMGQGGSVKTLLHEAIHAGTQRLLLDGKTKAAKDMQRLFDYYREFHDDKSYAFTDVHEFVSEAFTSNKFQRLLAGIDVAGVQPKGRASKMWGEFKEIIRDALNIPEANRTALDEVLDAGTSLISRSKDFKVEGKDGVVSGSAAAEEHLVKTAPGVAKELDKVDPASMPNKEAMYEHATDLYERYGEDVAIKFVEDFQKAAAERTIPIKGKLEDILHKIDTWQVADQSEHVTGYKENTKKGVTKEQRKEWFDLIEEGKDLPPEAKTILDAIAKENTSLVKKAKGMGLDVGDEFTTGQSRIRLYEENKTDRSWKDMVKEFWENKTPFTEKVADQANAAHERKVFQLDDGRVVEIHRQAKSTEVPIKGGTRKVHKGTEFWEWKDGKKKQIGHSDNVEFKRGDKVKMLDGKEVTMVDGKVADIEKNSPYRYLHDAEASARLANMGLRKMVRDAEVIEHLKASEDFKAVAHGPEESIKTIPDGWKVPESIDKIPQLRGYHFDPKTAAIIEDFAKVWEPNLLSKLSNAVIKNMMLNPLPHMFNEVMHLFNARGFTSWVPGTGGWKSLSRTGGLAWRDVGQQTQFYRDIMREGGAILGATPRNKYFDTLIKDSSREMFGTKDAQRGLGQLAKKVGTTVGDLYNGLSNKSQQAMWFTRDVMYVQYVREIISRSEKATGKPMELKDAIAKAERHMPNYRMPSEVLGSRGLSKTLKNPNISVFARYHYGMVKSLVNTLKDVNPKNLKTVEGRAEFREGVDSMLAIGVAMAVLYPLMDQMAVAMFGEGAEQRRAGPYHLLNAGVEVAEGKKDASALIWPVFTFNPMLLTLGQLAFNKNIFTGKKIYNPDDPAKDIAADVGTYAVKQIPQAPGIMGASDGEGGGKLLAKNLDIKVKTEKQRQAERTARKREAAAAKGRIKKRAKGEM